MNEQFIYLVSNENGGLELISPSLASAEKFISDFGNANWTIDSEVMC